MTVQLQRPVICPVFIGRSTDLTILHSLINEAKNGNGQVFLISGEAGNGISERLHVRMDNGSESEIGPGGAQFLLPGHYA